MDFLEECAQRLAFDVMLLTVLLHAGLRAVPSLPKERFQRLGFRKALCSPGCNLCRDNAASRVCGPDR